MANIMDYLDWRGDLSFEAAEFNEVDNLILAQLVYVDFTGIVPEPGCGEGITLKEASARFFQTHEESEILARVSMTKMAAFLMQKMAQTRRFADILLSDYVNDISDEEQSQFSVVCITLEDDSHYISFCGTDNTIVGWREDFNMGYLTATPGQRKAVDYLNRVIAKKQGNFRVGGHSKGGNLAIYAAMNADPKVRKRIQHVYSLDGPGFPPEIVTSPAYRTIQPKVTKIVPSSSIVGMIFETPEPCRVVSSDSDGIMQHSAFTWLLDGDQFITEPDLSSSSQLFNEERNHWIATLTPEQRERAVDALFTVLHANGATSFSEVMGNFPASIPAMLGAYVGLTPADRRHLVEALAILFKASTAKRKPTPAPASAPSSATSKATAEIPAETAAGADSAAPARADTDADAGTTASPSAEDATEIAD